MSESKFLLYPADGDIDEDEGMTIQEMLVMLAEMQGYDLVKKNK